MNPGVLRERVTIQQLATSADGAGGQSRTWSTLVTVWARVQPLAAREQFVSESLRGVEAFVVTIRYRAAVTHTHRVVWRGRTLNITAVTNPDQQRHYMQLACETDLSV